MADIDALAAALFGSKRAETQEVLTDATTRTYMGTALTDSKDGTVFVDLGGDVTLPDDVEGLTEHSAEGIEVSTGPGVRAGDEVIVTLVGGTPLKTPMVTGVAGEGDDQDARIATASAAAEEAWQWADEAHTAATDAQASASAAQESASSAASAAARAEQSAQQAIGDAARAESAAQQAIEDAADAAQAAGEAKTSAQQAVEEANEAHDAATAAQAEASRASQSATEAKGAATRANTAANDALAQVATVEDVIGVVDWVTEHGTYSKTTDTAIDAGKVYYTRTGSGTQADPYLYAAVPEPVAEDLGTYYELSVQEALSQYVASHLALTDAGLYILKDGSGYRLLLTNDGMQVIDPAGHTVATYGESITFDSERPQRIGGTDSYIEWRDTNGDGTPDSLVIVADSIKLGSGQSVSTGSGNVWANHTSATSASGISSWSDSFVAPTTAKPYVWMKSYSVIDGQRVYGNPACITGAKGADGQQGPQGPQGETGVGVESYAQMWAKSTSKTTAPTSGWSASRPTSIGTNEYLWVRVDTTWTGNTTTQGTPVVDQNTTDLWHTSAALRVDVDSIDSDVDSLKTTVSGHTTTIQQHTTSISQNAEDIALRATKTEAYQVAQPNLVPWFSAGEPVVKSSSDPYWKYATGTALRQLTDMGDGWCRIVIDNTNGSAVARFDYDPVAAEGIELGKDYTFLFEFRNIANNTMNSQVYAVQAGTYGMQFWGNSADKVLQGTSRSCGIILPNSYAQTGDPRAELCDDGIYRKRIVRKSEASDSEYWTRSNDKRCVRLVAYANAGGVFDAEMRFSIYPGEYTGPYKPYSGTQLYASQAELKVQSDRIGMVVSNTDASSSLALTADAMEYIGDHVEIKGTDGTSTVISGGKVQANSIGADEINATSINASNSLTVGALTTATQADILNSNVQVGGRNLFADSKALSTAKWTFDQGATRGDNLATLAANVNSRIYQLPANGYWSWKPNTDYVVSVEAKASASGGKMTFNMVGAGGNMLKTVDLTTSWARYSWAFTSSATVSTSSASIYNSTNTGTVQVRLPKLEEGNKATDWTPAPEDTQESIDTSVGEVNASLVATEDSLSQQIQDTNDGLSSVSATVTQLNTIVQQDRADIGRWLNFNESEGLVIGKSGSQFKVVTDETRQAFMYGNETLAYTSGDRFVAPRMEADELHIGNWMWVKRDNGNLSLKWIG